MGQQQSLANPSANQAKHFSGDEDNRQEVIPWLPLIGLGILTFNSITAVRRSIHDHDYLSVAFVGVSYADLLLLYHCFRLVERTASDDTRRRNLLKAVVWSLASLLTAMLSFRVASIMPPAVAALIWAMSLATVGGGFYALFLYREEAMSEIPAEGKKVVDDAYEKC